VSLGTFVCLTAANCGLAELFAYIDRLGAATNRRLRARGKALRALGYVCIYISVSGHAYSAPGGESADVIRQECYA